MSGLFLCPAGFARLVLPVDPQSPRNLLKP
jgi:hypothetical protein